MLQLHECTELQQYRSRCETDTEATRTLHADDTLRLKLLSLICKDTAKIRFHNLFERQVRAVWIDFDGHEVLAVVSGHQRLDLLHAT